MSSLSQVSEGIDFADGRARCVMVVGIPYPHAKDSKVALKKDYNNATAAASARAQHTGAMRQGVYGGGGGAGSSRGAPPRLLTGDAWYSQQAFRALNQVRERGTVLAWGHVRLSVVGSLPSGCHNEDRTMSFAAPNDSAGLMPRRAASCWQRL